MTLGSGKKASGAAEHSNEWILEQDEEYMLRMESTAAGWVSWHLSWYEHTNHN